MVANNHNDLLQIATEIARKAFDRQDNQGEQLEFEQIIVIIEQLDSVDAKIVALLNHAMQNAQINLDYLNNQGFPSQITEALFALRPLEAESYEEYLDRVMSSPIALQVKIVAMRHHLDQVKNQTPKTDDQSKQVIKQEIVLKRLSAALEWHMGRTVY
jgi:ABC-type transporter Mla MlaB component